MAERGEGFEPSRLDRIPCEINPVAIAGVGARLRLCLPLVLVRRVDESGSWSRKRYVGVHEPQRPPGPLRHVGHALIDRWPS